MHCPICGLKWIDPSNMPKGCALEVDLEYT